MTESSAADKLPYSRYAQSFGCEAVRYDRYRPGYPATAIASVFDGLADRTGKMPDRIVDLGAGTGKLTALLIGRAQQVIAIEPDEAMLTELRHSVPDADARQGSAEATGLPSASVDAVFVGQAFHWFKRPDADTELARVLRPGGVAGLLWNYPDRNVAWIPKLYAATGDQAPPWTRIHDPLDHALFSEAEHLTIPFEHTLDGPEGLLNLVRTWSWVITLPASERAEIDDRVRQLIAEYPQLQGEIVIMPQQTTVIRQYRR